MKRVTILFLAIPLLYNAQTDNVSTDSKPVHTHQLTFDFAPAAYLQRYLTFGYDAQITWKYDKNWIFNLQSFNAISPFDFPRHDLDWKISMGNQNVKTLSGNQTSAVAIRRLTSGQSSIDETTKREFFLGARMGYYYSQGTIYSSIDDRYYQFDTTDNGEAIYVNGFQTHAASVGLDFSLRKDKSRISVCQHLYADMLIGLNMQFTGMRETSDKQYYSAKIHDSFSRNYLGARLGYELRIYGKGHFGGYLGMEALYKPSIDYKYNKVFTIPRGGEGTWPYAACIRIGVTYRFVKHIWPKGGPF